MLAIEKAIESVKIKRLKQCPLCGWKRIIFDLSGELDSFVIQCPYCRIIMNDGNLTNCRNRWNQRPSEHCYNDFATTLLMDEDNIIFDDEIGEE